MTIKFDMQSNTPSIIKVVGVGGGGSNAVNHMYDQGIKGVDFIVSNTDQQALHMSPVPNKIQLGASLTEGLGAGAIPDTGKKAALETIDEIKEILQKNTKMVFITAGMGGGTGTGAAPVIAQVAKEMGILTVGIVTIPFSFEGKKRKQQAEAGLEEMRKYVDTLLVICNDKLRELYRDLKLSEAFHRADDILTVAAKGIAEIITVSGYINVDFNDVNTVMRNSGAAIMGTGIAEGEDRAVKAVEMALSSPLLNDNDINGAQNILLYIASGKEEITMDEVSEITSYIQSAAGMTAEIIWGNGNDDSLGDNISVTLIASGFKQDINSEFMSNDTKQQERKVRDLDEKIQKTENIAPVVEDEMKLIKKDAEQEDKYSGVKTSDEQKNIKEESHSVINFVGEESPVQVELKIEDNDFGMFKYIKQVETVTSHVNEPLKQDYNEFNPNVPKKELDKTDKDLLKYKSTGRVSDLRELSQKIKNQEGLKEIEDKPAYLRRNFPMVDNKPSSESEISNLSLGETSDKKTDIKPNSYLHDNVD